MTGDISEYASNCPICLLDKRSNERRQGLFIYKFEKEVNGIWYIDTIRPLPGSNQHYKYCRIVVDGFSRRTYLERMRSLSSQNIMDQLLKLMTRRDYPASISRYNASIFTSGFFKDFLFKLGIRDVRISPFQAKSSLSEMYVFLFRQGLRVYCNQAQNTWTKYLSRLRFR